MDNKIKLILVLATMSLGLNFWYIYDNNIKDNNTNATFADSSADNFSNIEQANLSEIYTDNISVTESITATIIEDTTKTITATITETITEDTTATITETITEDTTATITATILTTQEQDINNNNNKININTATLEELDTLPSIGEVLAGRIIEYRTNVSLFNDISDIINVSGIGEKTYENFKDFISVD